MTAPDPALLAQARAAGQRIAPLAAAIDAGRRLPAEAVSALVEAGAFKLAVPRALGGAEASPATLLAVLEELSAANGSAGWCAMIGATTGLCAALLPEPFAREVFAPAGVVTCGVFAPMGAARREGDGLRVSGRWPFASGCEHSAWRMGGVLVASEPPDLLPGGAPHVRSVFFRADETRVVDTWDTLGLRGTGSHDLVVEDVLVPPSRVLSLVAGQAWAPGPLYRLPVFGLLAAGIAAVAIGIARSALEAVVELARTKQAAGARRAVAHRELVQLSVGTADAKVAAARAALLAALGALEGELAAGPTARPSLPARARLRLAAVHATAEAASAVDLAYEAAGGSSIHAASPLQRAFRDVHTATQHVMVSKAAATLAGRVLLGLETDTSTL